MKLHLPKALFTALLAACAAQTSWGADAWTTPEFEGPEFLWTGAAGDNRWETGGNWQGGAAPSRSNTYAGNDGDEGAVLLFDNVSANVSNGDLAGKHDTADFGGIKVTGNSDVTCTLGRWGGAIYVEEGSSLFTSYSNNLKDSYAGNVANVYVGGALTITNSGVLNLSDGDSNQKWIIDTNGSINLSSATSVAKKEGGSWELQYWKGSSLGYEGEVLNRTIEEITFEHTLISSKFNLNDFIDSVTLIDKATGNVVSADDYTLNYGENGGLTVSYTADKYAVASLETSGDITWAHGTAGWTVQGGDGANTTFLNGDTVHFTGEGTATISGEVSVANISVADGVDYTLAMNSQSSLSVDAQQSNFGANLKITSAAGDSTTALYLNMSTDASADGDARIMLEEGSSVGAIYATGVVAYNKNDDVVTSNLGGAELHLANSGVLLVRNGVSGTLDANIGDIYFDGEIGELRVYGTVLQENNASIDNRITAAGELRKTDGGTINLTGQVQADTIISNGGALGLSGSVTTNHLMAGGGNITISGAVTAGQLRLKEGGGGTVTVSTGGILNITGTANDHSKNDSIVMSHWGTGKGGHNTTGLIIDGGALNAAGAVVMLSWDSSGFLKVKSGEASVKGINYWGQTNVFGLVELGSVGAGSSADARLNIGSVGIKDFGTNNATGVTFQLGNGTLGATENWSTYFNSGFTPGKFTLVGTGDGTVIDTTDAIDSTIARHITFNNAVTGSGKLVVSGKGTLTFTKASDYTGGTTINENATLKLASGGDFTLGGSVTGAGTLQVESGTTLKNNGQEISSKLVLNGGNAQLGGEKTLKGDVTIKNGSTLSFVSQQDIIDYDTHVTWRVEEGGTLDFGTIRQAFGDGSVLELAGGQVTGTDQVYNNTKLGVLDLMSGSKVHAVADTTVEANVRLRATIEFEVDENKSLNIAGALRDDTSIAAGRIGALKKTGDGTLKLSNANDYSYGTYVNAGILETANAKALGTGKVTVEGGMLKLAEALSVSAMDYISGSIQADKDLTVKGTLKVACTGDMTVTGSGKVHAQTLQLESGASFTAGGQVSMDNLTMNAGSAITADSAVALNGTLTLEKSGDNSRITLSGTVLDTLAGLQAPGSGQVVLFTGVDSLVMGGQTYTVGPETLNSGSGVKLSDYFRNDSEIEFEKYYLAYNATLGELTAGLIVPEPTTATLSLLALAGLCARRRRK